MTYYFLKHIPATLVCALIGETCHDRNIISSSLQVISSANILTTSVCVYM